MKQKEAAKFSIQSLILNVVLCAIFVKPLGAAGLALASSLSGVFLLYKNIKEFGFNNFLAIIKFRKFVPILAICVVEVVILYFFKGFINGYF